MLSRSRFIASMLIVDRWPQARAWGRAPRASAWGAPGASAWGLLGLPPGRFSGVRAAVCSRKGKRSECSVVAS